MPCCACDVNSPYSYGYNTRATNGYPLGTGASLGAIENPTKVLMLIDTDRAPTAYNSGSYDWPTWSSYYPRVHNDQINMVHVDGHRYRGALGRTFHGGHQQFEIEVIEMGFRDGQDNRGADLFGGSHDSGNEIKAHGVERADGIAVLVSVAQHILHIDQGHDGISSLLWFLRIR